VRPLPPHVREFIAAAPVCRIATVRRDGRPHVIPVCPVFDGEKTIFVDLGVDSVSARALRHEPRVAVLIDEYHDDWSRLRKALLHCVAEPVGGAAQDEAWDLIRRKFPQYVTVDWKPRATMALRIDGWLTEGLAAPG